MEDFVKKALVCRIIVQEKEGLKARVPRLPDDVVGVIFSFYGWVVESDKKKTTGKLNNHFVLGRSLWFRRPLRTTRRLGYSSSATKTITTPS